MRLKKPPAVDPNPALLDPGTYFLDKNNTVCQVALNPSPATRRQERDLVIFHEPVVVNWVSGIPYIIPCSGVKVHRVLPAREIEVGR